MDTSTRAPFAAQPNRTSYAMFVKLIGAAPFMVINGASPHPGTTEQSGRRFVVAMQVWALVSAESAEFVRNADGRTGPT